MNNIFSLNKFRKIKENYYDSKENCLKKTDIYIQSNPRFKKFDQIYFYAGDYKDINKYGLLPLRYYYSLTDNTPLKSKKHDESIKSNNYPKDSYPTFKLYKNIDYISITNTFKYMFDKFKKGLFVIIRDNKIALYLPFSNANYKNNWFKQTYFTDEEKELLNNISSNNFDSLDPTTKSKLNKSIIDFMNKYPDQYKYRKINFKRNEWYANNCLLRNEFPSYEGELNLTIYKDLLTTLLKETTIPDCEFFINDRDNPLLKKDLTEPYEHLFDSDSKKIEKEYQFKKMCPILSKSITSKYADILMPTNDDWLYASSTTTSNKYFLRGCSNSYSQKEREKWNYDWKSKKPMCIFRGSATGCGITIDTNMRLKVADMSIDNKDILDAGIIDWNARPKKYKSKPIEIINTNNLRFKLANKITNTEKSNYKFILNIDGHVSAFRLSSELSMNSCILLVKSDYKMWYSDMLVEYVHYVPVKSDLSDLVQIIKWCIKNDKKCEEIAKNATLFFNKYLTKDGILKYMKYILTNISKNRDTTNLLALPKKIIKETKPTVALISVYRDSGNGERKRELDIFIKLMEKLLVPYANFKIYIIEQDDDGNLFNIGKLKNIGFDIADKEKNIKFDNFIFSDIDTIPDYDLMPYFIMKLKYPISLAIRGTRYADIHNKNSSNNDSSNKNKVFLGAQLGFNGEQFKKINGYPNNMYGWGGEDNALAGRIINSKIDKIYYPKKGSVIDLEETPEMKTINIIKEKTSSVKKEMLKYEKLSQDLKLWKENGLSNLDYNILDKKKISHNVFLIKVDLKKNSDMEKYPYLFDYEEKNTKNKVSNNVKDYFKNLKYEFI